MPLVGTALAPPTFIGRIALPLYYSDIPIGLLPPKLDCKSFNVTAPESGIAIIDSSFVIVFY